MLLAWLAGCPDESVQPTAASIKATAKFFARNGVPNVIYGLTPHMLFRLTVR